MRPLQPPRPRKFESDEESFVVEAEVVGRPDNFRDTNKSSSVKHMESDDFLRPPPRLRPHQPPQLCDVIGETVLVKRDPGLKLTLQTF